MSQFKEQAQLRAQNLDVAKQMGIICPSCGVNRDQLRADLKDPDEYVSASDPDEFSSCPSYTLCRVRSVRHQAALEKLWRCPDCRAQAEA